MSRELLTTTAETALEEAAAVMRERKFGALPVVREKELIGLITESDIFRAFISLFRVRAHGHWLCSARIHRVLRDPCRGIDSASTRAGSSAAKSQRRAPREGGS